MIASKIAIFIDGAKLHATSKALGFDIDYKRLLKEIQTRGTLVRASKIRSFPRSGRWSIGSTTMDTRSSPNPPRSSPTPAAAAR
jgi:hypothetical protein